MSDSSSDPSPLHPSGLGHSVSNHLLTLLVSASCLNQSASRACTSTAMLAARSLSAHSARRGFGGFGVGGSIGASDASQSSPGPRQRTVVVRCERLTSGQLSCADGPKVDVKLIAEAICARSGSRRRARAANSCALALERCPGSLPRARRASASKQTTCDMKTAPLRRSQEWP